MASAVSITRPLAIERELVLTPSIWILYHFLSSRRVTSRFSPMEEMTGVIVSLKVSSSVAVWSDLVEMIRFPWLLKLAATTFMCFEV